MKPSHKCCVFCLLVFASFLAQVAEANDHPNFIVVMTDDQGWGDAGYAGHPRLKTPNLDAMARTGIRFDRFYATASMCSPTRVATLTGRNNLRFGIGGPISQGEDHLPKEEITIAEVLAPLGYISGHFGKWHVGDIVNAEDSSNITALDAAVGRLRNTLRQCGLADNTLLWFCSDNGPNLKGDAEAGLGSKGPYRGHKGQLYEGGIRVPGLLEWPAGISQPRVIHTPVVTSDFFPTFVELAGGDLPARPYDGISLVPLLKNQTDRIERNICFSTRGWLAIQNDKFKLVRPKGKQSSFELYDMESDPHETKNIARAHPETVRELRARLDAWITECEASQRGEDYSEGTSSDRD